MFSRILIARQSSAAFPVSRVCRRLGIETIGLHAGSSQAYSESCDKSVELSDPLSPEALVSLAKEHEVDAIHPGFCDVAEDTALARALEAEGLTYVGLDPDALETVRSRTAFRACVERANAQSVPSELAENENEANSIGYRLDYPLAIRPDVGPGHIIAEDEDELSEAWSKARALFGDEGALHVERWLPRARTIEVLVAADSEGAVEPVTECETTLRHGGAVLLEESPSPALTFRIDGEAIREMMFDIAIRVAKELGSVGLIRVEMVFTADGTLYTSGAQLGLPSLHAVLERATGLDLLNLQLQLAAGAPLPDDVLVLQPSGHAIGARIVAINEAQHSEAPSALRFPAAPQRSVVVEPSCAVGSPVPADDGAVLARVTSFAPIRHQAALTLDRLLAGSEFAPHDTNIPLIRSILIDDGFRAGSFDANSVPRLLEGKAAS